MSRFYRSNTPYFNPKEYKKEELDKICPRYIKWTKKVKAFDFSKRKKGKIDRSMVSCDVKHKFDNTLRSHKKSTNFLSRIRKGGQNLKVRCKTSADLWRRWIRGGIMYNTELNERDEDLEIQERDSKLPVNKVDVSIHNKENTSENNEIEKQLIVIEVTDHLNKNEEISQIKDKELQKSNLKVEEIEESNVKEIQESNVNEIQESNVNEIQESNVNEIQESNVNGIQESNVEEIQESNVNEIQESNVKELQESNVEEIKNLKIHETNIREIKVEENIVKSDIITPMPEVITND